MAHMTDNTALDNIISVLSLTQQEHNSQHTLFTGESLYFPTGRVYGGQVIAQSVMAASYTVDNRLPHSVHGYFISAGDISQDVRFDVEHLRDGRSFSSRRVNVTQSQGSILTAIASFQDPDQSGIDFADPMPQAVADPESLPSAKELMKPFAQHSPFANYYATQSPFDIRHVTPSVLLNPSSPSDTSPASGQQMVWMKVDGHVDVDQTTHRALLALGCDQLMLEPIMRRGKLGLTTPGIHFASLDHSMWWYRDIDMNQWHLYVQDSPTAAHGRGLSNAKVYDAHGQLVAAIVQEAMIRVPEK
ncbi:acyl-CoA thioesterase [Alloscardovia omnicolens]|uniref:acyl-CoA thioesterase n=1 Tax=Alloscardovia omnicolens TaxID=419015 RepID=UPI003A7AC1A3